MEAPSPLPAESRLKPRGQTSEQASGWLGLARVPPSPGRRNRTTRAERRVRTQTYEAPCPRFRASGFDILPVPDLPIWPRVRYAFRARRRAHNARWRGGVHMVPSPLRQHRKRCRGEKRAGWARCPAGPRKKRASFCKSARARRTAGTSGAVGGGSHAVGTGCRADSSSLRLSTYPIPLPVIASVWCIASNS